jgi:ribosomal protein L12E/L44/L45/RPP1/RPP2
VCNFEELLRQGEQQQGGVQAASAAGKCQEQKAEKSSEKCKKEWQKSQKRFHQE